MKRYSFVYILKLSLSVPFGALASISASFRKFAPNWASLCATCSHFATIYWLYIFCTLWSISISVDNCHCGTYGQSKILQYFLSFALYALSIRIHVAFFYCTMLVCARMFDHLSASEWLHISIRRAVFTKKACTWHIAKDFLSTTRACSWRWQRLNRCLFTGHWINDIGGVPNMFFTHLLWSLKDCEDKGTNFWTQSCDFLQLRDIVFLLQLTKEQ